MSIRQNSPARSTDLSIKILLLKKWITNYVTWSAPVWVATLANEVNHLLGFQGGNWFMLPRELIRNIFYLKHIFFRLYKLKFFVIESTESWMLRAAGHWPPAQILLQIITSVIHLIHRFDFVLRTRYRTKLGWFFWFWPIQRYNTTMGKSQIFYLRTTYRSKLVFFFWFGPIHMMIRRNLANYQHMMYCSH